MAVAKPLAQALVALIDGLSVTFTTEADQTIIDQSVKGYLWSQTDVSPPCAVVMLPKLERTAVDEQESQLGSRDFVITFEIGFLFDLSTPDYTQAFAIATVEAFIDALDASEPPLGFDSIVDAKVTSAGPPAELSTEGGRTLFEYPTTVEVLQLTV